MKRRSVLKLVGLACPASGAFAQTFSGRSGRLVVPLGAGTLSDYVARLVAPIIGTGMNMSLVVENKAGANGVIGVQDVMRSAPDGRTLLLGSASPLAINMALVKNLSYDPRRDLTPITGAYVTQHVVVVKASHPARTFSDFIAYAKERPGRVGIGSSSTLVKAQILAINKMAGIELLDVPYKATGPTFTDVLGGILDAAFTDMVTAKAQEKGGQVRILAVSSLKRNPMAPDWPAISETLPGFDFSSWSALVGPQGMQPDVVSQIARSYAEAMKQKDVVDKLEQAGILPWTTTPEELKAHIEVQTAKWIKLGRELNIQPE